VDPVDPDLEHWKLVFLTKSWNTWNRRQPPRTAKGREKPPASYIAPPNVGPRIIPKPKLISTTGNNTNKI
jgi:hypothetical protein